MKPKVYILWGVAIASLIIAAMKVSLVWIAVPLLGLALAYSLLSICIYRPPEDHVGVIYRFGRLDQLLGPDGWICVLPGIYTVKPPISRHVRRAALSLSGLLTQDQVPVDCELLAFYRLDFRGADTDFQSEALRIPEEGWNSVIRTVLCETAHEVISGIPFQQLLTPGGRSRLKHILSALLAERVQRLGMVVQRQTGVSIQALKPAGVIWQAMQDRWAAVSLGEAALARVLPVLQELSQQYPEIGWETLLVEWASVMVKDGAVPQVLVAPDQGPAVAALADQRQARSEGRSNFKETAPRLNGRREAGLAAVRPRIAG